MNNYVDLDMQLRIANNKIEELSTQLQNIDQQRRRELFEKVALSYLKPTAAQSEDGINYFLDLAAKHTEAILKAADAFATKGESK